jgi:hypothetical protein
MPHLVSTEEYLERYSTRLETLTEAGITSRVNDSTWAIPTDLVTRANELEEVTRKKHFVKVQVLSHTPVKEQIQNSGAAWIDQHLGESAELMGFRGSFRLEIERALRKRENVLKSQGLKPGKETFGKLLNIEEAALNTRLEARYGKYESLQLVKQYLGKVVGYELLGDGYRMVVKTNSGFTTRKVGLSEAQLPFQSEVTLLRVLDFSNGKRREFVKVRVVGSVKDNERSKRRTR